MDFQDCLGPPKSYSLIYILGFPYGLKDFSSAFKSCIRSHNYHII